MLQMFALGSWMRKRTVLESAYQVEGCSWALFYPTWRRGQKAGDTENHQRRMLRVKEDSVSLFHIFLGIHSGLYLPTVM
jgi:hypothetical protein